MYHQYQRKTVTISLLFICFSNVERIYLTGRVWNMLRQLGNCCSPIQKWYGTLYIIDLSQEFEEVSDAQVGIFRHKCVSSVYVDDNVMAKGKWRRQHRCMTRIGTSLPRENQTLRSFVTYNFTSHKFSLYQSLPGVAR